MRLLSGFKKPTSLIGLDIQTNAINLLELDYNKPHYTLLACAKTAVDPGNWVAALEQCLALSNPTSKTVALALDHCTVLFKTAEIDATLTEDEIFSHIRNRASQYLNLPLDELLLDFEMIGPAKTHPNLNEIRWVAAKRHSIAPWLSHLQHIGLNLALIDVNSLTVQRAAYFLGAKNTTTALVHISDHSLLLSILHRSSAIYTLAEPWQASLIIKDQDATKKILAFITRALQFYYDTENPPTITVILLSGHWVTADLATTLLQQTGINVTLANPWVQINISSAMQQRLSVYKAHEFMQAFGLALRCRRDKT